MRIALRSAFFILFVSLVVANLYIFVSSIKLAEKINFYEHEIAKFHQQNIDLEKKAYQVNSLQYTASEAAQLSFTKKVEPVYLDNLQYALKK